MINAGRRKRVFVLDSALLCRSLYRDLVTRRRDVRRLSWCARWSTANSSSQPIDSPTVISTVPACHR